MYCEIGSPPSSTKTVQLVILIVTEGIPILAAIFITFFAYILTIKRLKILPRGLLRKLGVHTGKLFWYPAVLILTFAPCIAYSFTLKSLGSDGSLIVKAIHLMLTHAIGFTNAVVYGIQTKKNDSDYEELGESQANLQDEVSMDDELRRELN